MVGMPGCANEVASSKLKMGLGSEECRAGATGQIAVHLYSSGTTDQQLVDHTYPSLTQSKAFDYTHVVERSLGGSLHNPIPSHCL